MIRTVCSELLAKGGDHKALTTQPSLTSHLISMTSWALYSLEVFLCLFFYVEFLTYVEYLKLFVGFPFRPRR